MVAAVEGRVDLWIQASCSLWNLTELKRSFNYTSLNIQVSFGRNVKIKMTLHGLFGDIRVQMSDTSDKEHAVQRLKFVINVFGSTYAK